MANLLHFPTPIPPPDAEQRQRALDITRSFIVEAPAGSGKTGLLIQRLLTLLATVEDPAEILTITFTRKATAELADRLLRQLSAASANLQSGTDFDRQTRPLALAVLAQDARLGWNLVDQPARINIRTIDAVCADIASTLPILSGSGGAQFPSEESSDLYADAARRTLAQLGGTDQPLNDALDIILLHRDANLAHCEALIASMLATRDQWGELIPLTQPHLDDAFLDREILPRIEKALDLAICRALTALNKILPQPLLRKLSALAAEMGQLDGYKGRASPIAICAGRDSTPEEKSAHLEHWRALIHLLVKPSKPRDFRASTTGNHLGFEILKHHQADLKQIIADLRDSPNLLESLCQIDQLPPATYPHDEWRVTKALFKVLSHALAELQVVFAERNRCDFTEIALLAQTALRHDSALDDLASASTARLQHLLVDEMQDTSTSQYELIQLLTRHWDGHSQTVFLVGDPKQSIYLFRQARVERFVQTMLSGRLGSEPDFLPLTPLSLNANFRSQRNLVEAFNHDFALVFPSRPEPNQPDVIPYHPASATLRASFGSGIVWHANPIPYTPTFAEKAYLTRAQRTREAEEICTLIEQWRTRALPPDRTEPWKIAILVQARSHLLPIVQALKRAGPNGPIPYRAIKIEPLAERQEILDLVALTRALLHPGDRTAWLALLRTPWVGLTLADLHRLAGADDHTFARSTILDLIQQRGELLSEDGLARVQPFWQIMQEALSLCSHLSLPLLVHRTWRAFGAAAFHSAEALLNVEQFFVLLDALTTESAGLDVEVLAERLLKLYAAASLNPDAVDLMTIHNAKGLEWDLVLVPSLERPGRPDDSYLLNSLNTDAGNQALDAPDTSIADGIIAPIRKKGDLGSSKLYNWISSVTTAREAAERKRLFYVACTRAREELHLFAAPQVSAKGVLAPQSRTLLAAAWPAAEPHFTRVTASVFQMPALTAYQPLDIAAAAAARMIARIPAAAARTDSPFTLPNMPFMAQPSHRPQGSFAARAVGNTLHALLELLARQIATGVAPASDVPTWLPRIATLLRAAGLAPTEINPLAQDVLRALNRTLASREGQWLLAAHPQAASEVALTSRLDDGETGTLRLDRTFLAGPTPHSAGDTHLWIVDYKTSSHAETNLEAWLVEQRETYREQLEGYARVFPQSDPARPLPIRLALFFPVLARLVWWVPQD